jgi:hypothetical protein
MFDKVVIVSSDSKKLIFSRGQDEDRLDFAKRVTILQGGVKAIEDDEVDDVIPPTVVYFRADASQGANEGFGEASIVVCKGDPRVENAVWTSDPYSIFE